MKQIILAGLLLSIVCAKAFTQVIESKARPDCFFHLATEQYREKEFPACFRNIENWFREPSRNPALLEHAMFLHAAAAYELNKKEASLLLIRFLDQYSASPLVPKAYYLLGCSALNAGEYGDAIDFFKHCPQEDLSPREQMDYQFRLAYASLQQKDYETARKWFRELMATENRYVGSATYFNAYMDYSEGNMKEAMTGFRKIADNSQYKDAVPYFYLQLLYIDGHYDEMLAKANQLMAGNPTPVQKAELIRLTGAAWFEKRDYAQSQRYYLDYQALNPKMLRSDLYRMGINYYTQRKYDTAIDYLAKLADSTDAVSQSSKYHLGLCYLKQGKKDLARMSFEQASLNDFDKNTKEKALYNYALLCYETSFSPFNEQVKAFQRILTEFPHSEFADKIYGYLSEVFLFSKEYENSLAVIEKIANPDKKILQAKRQLLFLLGTERCLNGQYKEAADLFTQSIELSGTMSQPATECLFWRGEAYYRMGQFNAAALDYKKFADNKGAAKMKAWPLVAYNLGYCFFNQKKYTDAKIWFTKYTAQNGIKQDKCYPDALNRIGDCYFQARDYINAEKFYQDADLTSTPGNDYAVYQKAFCLGLRKQYSARMELLKNFGTRFPQSDYRDDALFESGKTYIQLQKTDLAVAAFQQLMETFEGSPLARKAGIQIALLRYNEGQKKEAVAAYKNVIEKYPGSEEARVALNDLKTIYVNNNAVADYIDYTKGLGSVAVQAGEQDSLSFMAAEKRLMDGNYTEATESFRKYLNDSPNGAFQTDCHYHLGRLLLAEGKNEEALEHLEFVSVQDGHKYQVEATLLTAEAWYAKKVFDKALAAFERTEKLSSERKVRSAAKLGATRCSYFLNQFKETITKANNLISETDLNTDVLREARYYRAMSLLADGQKDKARPDLEALSVEVQTPFGAEARFRLADYFFSKNNLKESEKIVQNFIKEGTSQSYWLARSFVLLADINTQRKDDFQAKHYLLSLKENYTENNDIREMIDSRLDAIAKRNKKL